MYVIEVPENVFVRQGQRLGYAPVVAIAAPAAASGPLYPIVMAVAALLPLIAKLIGIGPSPYNVPTAAAEQIYEAAADKLTAAVQDGMITVDEAVAGMQRLIQAGTQHFKEGNFGDQRAAGLANMTKVIQAQISATQRLSSKVTKPIDVTAAAQYYPAPGTSGWYNESISLANDLVGAYLKSLPARDTSATQLIQSVTQLLPSDLSISSVLPWAAAGLLAFKLFAGG